MVESAERGAAPGAGSVRDLQGLALQIMGARLSGSWRPIRLTGLALHTAAVRPGYLFCCVPGERTDGHLWARAAVDMGASALLVERRVAECSGVPQLEVPRARAAVAAAARAFYGYADRDLWVAAVTGTNGKTTTTYMIEAMMAAAGTPVGRIGTVGCRIGDRHVPGSLTTPDPISLHRMLDEIRALHLHGVALEASSHALAQGRLQGVEVDTAVFTNLARDHLDYHGTPMAYFSAKRRLFLPRPGHKAAPSLAVICTDRPTGRLLARLTAGSRQVVTYGLRGQPDVQGGLMSAPGGGCILRVSGRFGRGDVPLPLPGPHNAQNALAALAACLANGMPLATAARGLAAMDQVPGRLERIQAGQPFAVIVDFAHNPQGLRYTLRTARSQGSGRLRLVFGCKGEDGDGDKRFQMGAVAGRWADDVVLTTDDPYGEDPAVIASQVESGLRTAGASYVVELDRAAAIRRAIAAARPGDVVVVAGRGHEARQPVAGGSVPFDDREVARKALQEPGSGGAAQVAAGAGG